MRFHASQGDSGRFDLAGGTGVLAPPDVPEIPYELPPQPPEPPWEPPDDFGGFGGWGGGGGDDARDDSDGEEPRRETEEARAGQLALSLVLAGITTLFCILMAVWLFLRRGAADWPPPEGSTPHGYLWAATLLLVLSSIAIESSARWARNAAARGRVLASLGASWVLGLAFVGVQVACLQHLAREGLLPSSSGYGAVFFFITGLHGLHVGGGLIYLASLFCRLVSIESFARRRSGVRLASVFWHFMGLLWVVLFILLVFVR